MTAYRNRKNQVNDIFVGKLRDLLFQIEQDFPGVRLVAMDTECDDLLYGEEYVQEQEDRVQEAVDSGELELDERGLVVIPAIEV